MAKRGTPLPWKQREHIRRLAASGFTVRQIAELVGVDKDTAAKYSKRK